MPLFRNAIRRVVPLMALVVIALPALAQFPRETYLGVFAGPTRIGYMYIKTDKADHDGKPGYHIETTLKTKMNLLGTEMVQDIGAVIDTDENSRPIRETFTMASGGSVTKIEAQCFPDKIECKLQSGDSITTKTLIIPEGTQLIGDAMLAMSGKPIEVGQKFRAAYFNPLLLSIDKLEVEVLRKERVELDSVFSGDTFVVRSGSPLGDITTWQEANGDVVKAETLMSVKIVRETREQSLSAFERQAPKPPDFAVLTSVKADKDIPNPRNVMELNVRLLGFPNNASAISDNRQRATPVSEADGKSAVDYEIRVKGFDARKSIKIPVKMPGLAHLLEESPYIQTTDQGIKAKAREIAGGEVKAYIAAGKISRWVKANMRSQTDIGVVRSASEVLKSKRGVCRDYAILYTSLARAAGIPTRLASGLVYLDGGFYYHVWAESFVGEWVAFDPTMEGELVDATHIKLAQGEATAMFEMAKVIGNLRAEIKGFKDGK